MKTRYSILTVFAAFAIGFIAGNRFLKQLNTKEAIPDTNVSTITSHPIPETQEIKRVPIENTTSFDSNLETVAAIEAPADMATAYTELTTDEITFEDELALSLLFERWASAEPWSALQYSRQANIHPDHSHALSLKAVEILSKTGNHGELLDWIESGNHEEMLKRQRYLALRGIADSDPLYAITWSLQLEGINQIEAISAVMNKWVENDTDSVANWLRNVPNDPGVSHAFASFMHVYTEASPEEAKTLIEDMPDTMLRAQLEKRYAAKIAAEDPRGAVDWSLEQFERNGQSQSLVAAFGTWASREPAVALTFALELGGSEQARQIAISQAAFTTTFSDAALVREHYREFDAETQRSLSLAIAQKGMSQDSPSTLQWADSLSDPIAADQAAIGIARHYAYEKFEPEKAFQAAAKIRDEQQRLKQLSQFAQEAYFYDPDRVEEMIAKANLTRSTQNSIINSLEKLAPAHAK